MTDTFEIAPLSGDHNRLTFSCGIDALDRYLRQQANQDMRRRIANCFVAVVPPSSSVVGYYTLSATSIPVADMPIEQTRRLPRYRVLPAALMGRLAVDRRYTGHRLGSALLFDALHRGAAADPAIFALVVDAKDDRAASFYRHLGFQPFMSRPMSFFLSLATAAKLSR